MNRFPDHARVVFIGDSITCGGIWIAHIYDNYLRHFPKSDIRMYNAGISGGSAVSALEYYDRGNGENYKPTHAVIMLGMNDVNRGLYEIKPEENDIADKRLEKRMEAIGNYEKRLRALTVLLLERGVKLTFVTPTIYDESTDPRALDKIGCDAGLEYLGEINRRVAAQTGSGFVNLHAPIRFLNAAHPMIRADRVHPNEFGHVCMAHLFLAAQGLVDAIYLSLGSVVSSGFVSATSGALGLRMPLVIISCVQISAIVLLIFAHRRHGVKARTH